MNHMHRRSLDAFRKGVCHRKAVCPRKRAFHLKGVFSLPCSSPLRAARGTADSAACSAALFRAKYDVPSSDQSFLYESRLAAQPAVQPAAEAAKPDACAAGVRAPSARKDLLNKPTAAGRALGRRPCSQLRSCGNRDCTVPRTRPTRENEA